MIDSALAAVPGGLATVGVLSGMSLALVVGLAAAKSGSDPEFPPPDATVEDEHDGEPQLVELDPPNLQTARWGMPQKLWRLWRHHQKRRKFASSGYIQWYLIDDTYPTPKFVKPKTDGTGIPYYEYDGGRYFFPKDARVPSEQEGIWTYMHKENEADPINLNEPTEYAIPADVVETYATLQVTTEPPGWLDNLNMDADEIVKYTFAAIIAVTVGYSLLGGGL